jgi:small basic protein
VVVIVILSGLAVVIVIVIMGRSVMDLYHSIKLSVNLASVCDGVRNDLDSIFNEHFGLITFF